MKTKKLLLNGQNRYAITEQILPQNGHRVEMLVAEEIENIIKIKGSEADEVGMVQVGTRIEFLDEKAHVVKEFELTEGHINLLKDRVRQLGEAGQWTRFSRPACKLIEGL